jgi:hypothetical protein
LKSGYVVNVGAGEIVLPATPPAATCNNSGAAAIPTYFAEAHPSAVGSSGQRSFGTDHRATIFQDNSGTTFTQPLVASATTPAQ